MPNILKARMLIHPLPRYPRFSKKDKRATEKVLRDFNANSPRSRFQKALLPDDALEPFRVMEDEIKTALYAVTAPWMDDGARILKPDQFEPLMIKFREIKARWEAAREVLVENYPALVENARQQLNGLFVLTDYVFSRRHLDRDGNPRWDVVREALRKRITFEVKVLPVPDADDFRVELAADVLAELKANMDNTLAEVSDAARIDGFRRLAEPVAALLNTLRQNKSFHITDAGCPILDNIRDIAGRIPALNVTDDPMLSALSAECANLMVNPADLRESNATRAATEQKAMDILTRMSVYLNPE